MNNVIGLSIEEDRLDWWLTLKMLKKDVEEEEDLRTRQRWINAYNWALQRYCENSLGH